MVWNNLGVVTLEPNWIFIGNPIESETIKIAQSYTIEHFGYFLIGQGFSISPFQTFGVFRVYPSRAEQIKVMPPPDDLKQAGYTQRYIVVKLHPRTLLWQLKDWQVTVEYWT